MTHGDLAHDGRKNDHGEQTVAGTLHIVAEDHADQYKYWYFLETKRESIPVRLDNVDTEFIESGQRLAIDGSWNDRREFVATSIRSEEVSKQVTRSFAEKGAVGKLCVVLVTYTNDPNYYDAAERSQEEMTDKFKRSVAAIKDITRGRYDLTSGLQVEKKSSGMAAPSYHDLMTPLPFAVLRTLPEIAPSNPESCMYKAWVLPTHPFPGPVGFGSLGGTHSSFAGHHISQMSIMHELGHNFGLGHATDDRLDPMGGVNHNHYSAPNMMTMGVDLDVNDLSDLEPNQSATIALRPIESKLEATRHGNVYLYGTNLKHASKPVEVKPYVPFELGSNQVMPVIVLGGSGISTTFLDAGDPADPNWNFVYNDVSYSWHPSEPGRVQVTRLAGNCPPLKARITARGNMSTEDSIAYDIRLETLHLCHSGLDLEAIVNSEPNARKIALNRTTDWQRVFVPIRTPKRDSAGELRVKLSLSYTRNNTRESAQLVGTTNTTCRYKPVGISVNVSGANVEVRFDRSRTTGTCFAVPFDLEIGGDLTGQITENDEFLLAAGQTVTTKARLDATPQPGQKVRVMNGSRSERSHTAQ
ncbi:MAG TPA: hypothetical protein VM580_22005 [Labilithrix sp.]|nr:hypothetical protein [Labilithrix sp.]